MRKSVWISIVVVLLLLVGGAITWALSDRPDPVVEEARRMRQLVFSPESRELPDEERRELREQLTQIYENMTAEQRQEVRRQGREHGMQRMRERMKKYFALSDEEKVAYLDEEVDSMEERRQRWEQRNVEGRGGPGLGRRGNGQAQAGNRRGGEGSGGPRGDRGRTRSAEDRSERRRGMLDRTTAKQRAQFTAYFEDLNQRRKERGLEPMRFGRGRR